MRKRRLAAMNPVRQPVPALRIALVGKRDLGPNSSALETGLRQLFAAIDEALEASPRSGTMESVSIYAEGRAQLNLISGLADGADQLASAIFLDNGKPDLADRSIAVILPCAAAPYLVASPMRDAGRFAHLLRSASYVVELDGDRGTALEGEHPAADAARIAAFRAQAEVLLRHADMLLAIDDTNPGSGGGTLETTRRALTLGLPVIRFVVGSADPSILRAPDDLEAEDLPTADVSAIAGLVRELVYPRQPHSAEHAAYDAELIDEYFHAAPLRSRWRQRLSRLVEGRPLHEAVVAEEDHAAPPLQPYLARADALNRHYARLYRGTFVLGYGLAVFAVCLAVLALIVILRNPSAHSPDYLAWWGLLGLGLGKLATVIWIQRAAVTANRRRWSERAADYRYLAEGLRTMAYLPSAGSFRPPGALSAPFATRVVAQGNVERLLHALVRQATPDMMTPPEAPGVPLRPDPDAALASIRKGWIGGQIRYHRHNAAVMANMSRRLERLANRLSLAVVVIVALDLALLVADGLHLLPYDFAEIVHKAAPWLLFLAAILPAAVASVNGIRFQSECARLADRSERMVSILEALEERATRLADKAGASGRRVRTVDVLRLGEDVARITLDEVADWSALYAKEMVEP